MSLNRNHPVPRPPRVKLAGSVLALIRFENGRQLTAKLHQISASGGVVHVSKPVDEGIKVEVIFHIGSTIRTKATMLFPMWATQGYLQPFQFSELADEDRQQLESGLHQFLPQADVPVS